MINELSKWIDYAIEYKQIADLDSIEIDTILYHASNDLSNEDLDKLENQITEMIK